MSQPIHKMQRYILGWAGLMLACGFTYPVAMARVSAMKEFPGQSVKSQDCANKPLPEQKVLSWATACLPLKVEPIAK